jgi:hypothetical protein
VPGINPEAFGNLAFPDNYQPILSPLGEQNQPTEETAGKGRDVFPS